MLLLSPLKRCQPWQREVPKAAKFLETSKHVRFDHYFGVLVEPCQDSLWWGCRLHDSRVADRCIALRVPLRSLEVCGPRDAWISLPYQFSPAHRKFAVRTWQAIRDVARPLKESHQCGSIVASLRRTQLRPDRAEDRVQLCWLKL